MAERDEPVERLAQPQIARRHGHPRKNRQVLAVLQRRLQPVEDGLVAAAAASKRAQPVVDVANAVETDRDGKAMTVKERGVVRPQQSAVGGDRKPDRYAVPSSRPQPSSTLLARTDVVIE